MRRIYIVAWLITIVIAYLAGSYSTRIDGDEKLAALQLKKDSIQKKFEEHMVLVQHYKRQAYLAQQETKRSDHRADSIQVVSHRQAVRDERRIAEVKNLSSHQIDTLFEDRFPDSTRTQHRSYNAFNADRPIVQREWKMRRIAFEFAVMDSIRNRFGIQNTLIGELNVGIASRELTISSQAGELREKGNAILDLLEDQKVSEQVNVYWKDYARKYKRQRNTVLVGASAVVVGTTIILVKAALR